MHIVSSVKGRLRPGLGPLDAFKSVFPAGTVSGAPKIMACKHIYTLEKQRRGLYAGALGSEKRKEKQKGEKNGIYLNVSTF